MQVADSCFYRCLISSPAPLVLRAQNTTEQKTSGLTLEEAKLFLKNLDTKAQDRTFTAKSLQTSGTEGTLKSFYKACIQFPAKILDSAVIKYFTLAVYINTLKLAQTSLDISSYYFSKQSGKEALSQRNAKVSSYIKDVCFFVNILTIDEKFQGVKESIKKTKTEWEHLRIARSRGEKVEKKTYLKVLLSIFVTLGKICALINKAFLKPLSYLNKRLQLGDFVATLIAQGKLLGVGATVAAFVSTFTSLFGGKGSLNKCVDLLFRGWKFSTSMVDFVNIKLPVPVVLTITLIQCIYSLGMTLYKIR